MVHPKYLSIDDHSYLLPEEKIAKYPLEQRDSSKLLVYKDGKIDETIYEYLAENLPADSFLIFNNTKVVEARLHFTKASGSSIEIFCLEPDDGYADITAAMLQKEKVHWKCLVGGAKKWKAGEHLIKEIKQDETIVELKASMLEKRSDCFLIELNWNDVNLSFAELLYIAGEIPLPPYLNRVVEEHDKKTYQTVYARNDGSVAAPTAGLHFTENLFRKLSEKNIAKDFVTLHVGAGTFKPVKSETMEGHEMHAEFIDVSIETINNIINHLDKTIIAVGTTSLRTIESLYWMGVKVNEELKVKSEELNEGLLTIKQWEAYELPQDISAIAALSALTKWMQQHNMQKIIAKTQIIIAPGYDLRIAKGLLTNFHQPKSTLLLLVAAIVGDDWKKIYNHALENNFRFLSYGDGCLLWKREV